MGIIKPSNKTFAMVDEFFIPTHCNRKVLDGFTVAIIRQPGLHRSGGQGATEKKNSQQKNLHDAPLHLSTAGMVPANIWKSRSSDQVSI